MIFDTTAGVNGAFTRFAAAAAAGGNAKANILFPAPRYPPRILPTTSKIGNLVVATSSF